MSGLELRRRFCMMGDDSWLDITSQTNNTHHLSSKFQPYRSKLMGVDGSCNFISCIILCFSINCEVTITSLAI